MNIKQFFQRRMPVVIATAHRVGSTWLYKLLMDAGDFKSGRPELPPEYFDRGVIDINNNTIRAMEKLRGRKLYKSHSFPPTNPGAIKYVTVLRHPKDVILSNAWMMVGPECLSDKISKLIEGRGGKSYILDRLEAWANTEYAIKIRYGGLAVDPAWMLRPVLFRLNIPTTEKRIQAAVKANPYRRTSDIIGGWQDYFGPHHNELFDTALDGRWDKLRQDLGY